VIGLVFLSITIFNIYNLNSIENKTAGGEQHATARFVASPLYFSLEKIDQTVENCHFSFSAGLNIPRFSSS